MAEPLSAKQRRLVLSCTKCRSRKVKCDRVRPCHSCCVRGEPSECTYATSDASDFQAVTQSYEIRRLRSEVKKWKDLAQTLQPEDIKGQPGVGLERGSPSFKREDSDESTTEDKKWGRNTPLAQNTQSVNEIEESIQKDGLYFGAPSMSTVVAEYANFHLKPKVSLKVPRTVDVYNHSLQTTFCFPTFWKPLDGLPTITACLPSLQTVLELLEFYRRSATCAYPLIHDEFKDSNEIVQFFHDLPKNSEENPSKLALIFIMLALGVQFSVYHRHGYKWVKGAMEAERRTSEIYLAASMQTLRYMSFMNRPNTLVVQTMLSMLPYLTNSGRFSDAWVLLGPIIRIAQSMGFHRNPAILDPLPSEAESSTRRILWWWIQYQDVQYSMTTGRPLGVSGLGDSPPPRPKESQTVTFEDYILPYTILLRQALSANDLNDRQVDDFTDQLLDMHSKLPDPVRFNPRIWLRDDFEPLWPQSLLGALHASQTHNLITILNRKKRAGNRKVYSSLIEGDVWATGQERILISSRAVLSCQAFIHKRMREGMLCWTQNQESFNAAMILGLNLVNHPESERSTSDRDLVRSAYYRFLDMEQVGLHDLASIARVNLEKLLAQIDTVAGVRDHVRNNLSVAFCPTGLQNQSLMTEAGILTPDSLTKRGDIRMASWCDL